MRLGPYPPQDDYDGYEQVKKALADSGIMLTTAEHEYTRYAVVSWSCRTLFFLCTTRSCPASFLLLSARATFFPPISYGFRELIKRKAVDILQPDITWIGGMTGACF